MKNWECTICTFVQGGENPPEVCPFCGTPKEQFIPTDKEPTPTNKAG